jgi:ribosome maturation factor RimP
VDPKSLKEWQIVEPVIGQMGYELVGVEMIRSGRYSTLRIYIDAPAGVTLDDCVAVSRHVSGVLDVEDPIKTPYQLEVSSPGLDRPLFKIGDYERFAGSTAKVKMLVPHEGRRNFTGVLRGLNGDRIRIEVDEQVFELEFEHIERTRLVPNFDN